MIKVEEKSGMQYKEEESNDRKYDLDEGSKSLLLKQHMFVEQQQRNILVSCSGTKFAGWKAVNLHAISDFDF